MNPFAGTKTLFHTHDDGQFSIETVADVEATIELNKRRFNDSNRHQIGGEGHGVMVASIPVVLYDQLMREGIAEDNEAMLRWLRDPDNRLFRTHEMKV